MFSHKILVILLSANKPVRPSAHGAHTSGVHRECGWRAHVSQTTIRWHWGMRGRWFPPRLCACIFGEDGFQPILWPFLLALLSRVCHPEGKQPQNGTHRTITHPGLIVPWALPQAFLTQTMPKSIFPLGPAARCHALSRWVPCLVSRPAGPPALRHPLAPGWLQRLFANFYRSLFFGALVELLVARAPLHPSLSMPSGRPAIDYLFALLSLHRCRCLLVVQRWSTPRASPSQTLHVIQCG